MNASNPPQGEEFLKGRLFHEPPSQGTGDTEGQCYIRQLPSRILWTMRPKNLPLRGACRQSLCYSCVPHLYHWFYCVRLEYP